MSRPAAAFLAFAVLAPAPALAQVWPAAPAVTAVAAWLRPATPLWAFPPAAVPAAPAAPAEGAPAATEPAAAPAPTASVPVRLDLRPSLQPDAQLRSDLAPKVELRAKSEWTDDQGFSTSATRLFYKRRF